MSSFSDAVDQQDIEKTEFVGLDYQMDAKVGGHRDGP